MWAALPPVGWWPLGWIAPVPWLLLARDRKLAGRRPYLVLWLAGFAFWLGILHWLRLPHPETSIGWVALSFYLAFYIPVFIGLVRVGVHRLGLSIVLVAPLVWTGLELAKGHLLSGFTMGSLAHSQYRWLAVIQIADVVGCYGVSGLLMFVAACVARMIPWQRRRAAIWPLLPLVVVMAGVLLYGFKQLRLEPALDASNRRNAARSARVALIQGAIDTEMKSDPGQGQRIYDDYMRLSRRAVLEAAAIEPKRPVDLIVWPETMFRASLLSFDPGFQPPPGVSPAQVRAAHESTIAATARSLDTPLLLGIDRAHIYSPDREDHYNTALFVSAVGKLLAQYDKMHPVMFGEYVPLADKFPFLYHLTPLPGGLTPGAGPVSQEIHGVRYAPNICFETCVPHLIRHQVLELRERGEEPDVLVNLTNDGWFWGSSELDLHLMCGVFRAVECRKPLLIAANTGFSAWIDADGRVRKQGPRRSGDPAATEAVILADVEARHRDSFYLNHGDWLAGGSLVICLLLGGIGVWDRFGRKA